MKQFPIQDVDVLAEVPGDILAISVRGPASACGELEANDCRALYPETVHRGWALVVDEHGLVVRQKTGADKIATFFRSSAKPFQALAWFLQGRCDLTSQELAMACASHSSTLAQVHWVQKILSRLHNEGVDVQLACGPHPPIDPDTQAYLARHHQDPGAIHNNCSGKHAAMLWACQHYGWDMASYLEPSHPLQQHVLSLLKTWGNLDENVMGIGTDGCGLPTYYLPLAAMGRLYSRLITDAAAQPIVDAMVQHPELVGGPGRIDTALMQVGAGQLLSKVGADGLLCIANRSAKQVLVLKLADGNGPIRDQIAVHCLHQLGWFSQSQWDDTRLAPWRRVLRKNTLGDVIGETLVLPVFEEL